MKHKLLTVTLLSLISFAAGCKPSDENSTAQQLDQVKTETKAAAREIKDYTFAQKTEFVTRMQGQLDGINRELDELAAKIEKSSDAAKAEAKPKLQALREQTAQLSKQLDEAKNSTESTWDSIKTTTQKAFDSLQEGFQQSRQWLSDKIAP
jgi:hypothetical protein